jgi:hypothetical protein
MVFEAVVVQIIKLQGSVCTVVASPAQFLSSNEYKSFLL